MDENGDSSFSADACAAVRSAKCQNDESCPTYDVDSKKVQYLVSL